MLATPTRRSRIYNEILGAGADDLKALRALDRLYVGRKAVARPRRQPHPPAHAGRRAAGRAGRAARSPRAAARDAPQRDRRRPSRPTARCSITRTRTARRSRALERLIVQPEHELTIATILEPIYKARGEWTKQIGVYEIMARHAFDPARKIELLHQIAELHEIGGDNADARVRDVRARDARGSAQRGDARQLDRLARELETGRTSSTLYDSGREGEARGRRPQGRAAVPPARRSRRRSSATTTPPRPRTSACSRSRRGTSRPPPRSRRSTSAPATGPSSSTSSGARSRSCRTSTRASSCCFRAAQIEEEVLGNADAAIATFRQVLSIDDVDMPAMDALERLYVRLARWEPLKDVYAKKADLAEDPDEKKRCSTCSRRSMTASSATSRRRSRPTRASSISTPTSCPRSSRSTGSTAGRALVRPARQTSSARSSCRSRRARPSSLKYRIGHLWQMRARRLGARDRELPRGARDRSRARRDAAALDGLVHGKIEPVMAARVLEPIYETGGEFAQARRRARGDGRAQRGSARARRAAAPHRRAARADDRATRTRRSTRTRARCATTRATSSRSVTSSGSPRSRRAWDRARATLYEAEPTSRSTCRARSTCCSRLARVHEQELGDVDKAIATLPTRRSRSSADNKRASSRSIGCTSRPSVAGAHRDPAPRDPARARTTTRSSRCSSGSGSCSSRTSATRRRRSRSTARSSTPTRTHEPTLAALELMFHDGHQQIEIAGVLEPLYEAAEQLEKLHDLRGPARQADRRRERRQMYPAASPSSHEHKLFDQPRRSCGGRRPCVEEPQWELALEESERLAERVPHVGRPGRRLHARARGARPTTGDAAARRCSRLARVYEFELHDAARADETHLRVLEIEPKDADALAALDRLYLKRPACTTSSPRSCAAASRSPRHRRAARAVLPPAARVFADALGDSDAGARLLHVGPRQATRATGARSRRSSAIHFRSEAVAGAVRHLREADRHRRRRRGAWPTLRAHGARSRTDGARAIDDKAIDLWGRVLDLRGEEPMALGGARRTCTSAREQWHELVDDPRAARSRITHDPQEQIPLYKQLGRIWGEKLSRERNALEAWQKVLEIDPTRRSSALRALARALQPTQAWDELVETLHRSSTIGIGRSDMDAERARSSCTPSSASSRARSSCAPRRPIDAWQQGAARSTSGLPRARRPRAAVHARGALGRVHRRPRAARRNVLDDDAQKVETLLAGRVGVGRQDRRPRSRGRRLRAHPAARPAEHDRVDAARAGLSRAGQVGEAHRAPARARRVHAARAREQRRRSCRRSPRSTRRSSATRRARSSCSRRRSSENYADDDGLAASSSASRRRPTGGTSCSTSTRRSCQTIRRSEDRRRICGSRSAAGTASTSGISSTPSRSVQQALHARAEPHRGARGAGRLLPQDGAWPELVTTLQRHAELEDDPQKRIELLPRSMAELLRRAARAIRAQAIAAYQQALDARPGVRSTRSTRSSGSTAATSSGRASIES